MASGVYPAFNCCGSYRQAMTPENITPYCIDQFEAIILLHRGYTRLWFWLWFVHFVHSTCDPADHPIISVSMTPRAAMLRRTCKPPSSPPPPWRLLLFRSTLVQYLLVYFVVQKKNQCALRRFFWLTVCRHQGYEPHAMLIRLRQYMRLALWMHVARYICRCKRILI